MTEQNVQAAITPFRIAEHEARLALTVASRRRSLAEAEDALAAFVNAPEDQKLSLVNNCTRQLPDGLTAGLGAAQNARNMSATSGTWGNWDAANRQFQG